MNNKQTAMLVYCHNVRGCYGFYLPPLGPGVNGLKHRQILDIIKSYKRCWKAQTKITVEDNNFITITFTYES